jgi:Na+/H+-dicarboxylate symporter
MTASRLNRQVLIALVLAIVAGLAVDESATLFGVSVPGLFDFIGTLFVSALKMLIVPLVAASVIVGVANGGAAARVGRLSLRTVTFFLVTSIPAIVLGMLLVEVLRPGLAGGRAASDMLDLGAAGADLAEELGDKGFGDMLDMFLSIIPSNVFGAAAGDDLLGLVFFSVLFGYFMARLDRGLAEPLHRFWTAVFQIMLHMTDWVLHFAPVGVFCLVARVVAKTGFEVAEPLAMFAGVVLVALAGHALLTLPLLLRLVGRVSPLAHYRAVAPAVMTAFATSSALAALPVTLACMQQRAGVSNRVSGFVLPLAATVNMNGTALYHAAAAVFLAQAYGLDLDLGAQLTVLALAVVTSIGVPGLPAASLVAIAVIASAIGLPAEATGVLLAFDRALEMARTGVNVLGDTVCATLIARLEGEEGVLGAVRLAGSGD